MPDVTAVPLASKKVRRKFAITPPTSIGTKVK